MSTSMTDDPDYELIMQLENEHRIHDFYTDRRKDGVIRIVAIVNDIKLSAHVVGHAHGSRIARGMVEKARNFLDAHRKLTQL